MAIHSQLVLSKFREFQTYRPGRQLVCQGVAVVNGRRSRLFLFNDICLVTRAAGQVFRVASIFTLEGCKLEPPKDDSPNANVQKFVIYSPAQRASWSFVERKPGPGEGCWLKTFDDLLTRNNDEIFGWPLEKVLRRQSTTLPKVVASCLYRLNKSATLPGLFRIPPNPSLVRSLRRRFNQSDRDVDVSHANPHDLAALLLEYLEALPHPILEVRVLPYPGYVFEIFRLTIHTHT